MNGQQFFLVARVLPLESNFPVRHLRESRIDSFEIRTHHRYRE